MSKSLSITSLVLLSSAFLLIAVYKLYGGKNIKIIGEFGKIVFFIGVLLMAINQFEKKENYCGGCRSRSCGKNLDDTQRENEIFADSVL